VRGKPIRFKAIRSFLPIRLFLRRDFGSFRRTCPPEKIRMSQPPQSVPEQIAQLATNVQKQTTGVQPTSVSVVLCGDTLVVTLHGALSPAEQAMARTPEGAAKVQEYHRQLFQSASDALRSEISRITGMTVREAAAEVEPTSGAVMHVFTSGTMVQVFLLSGAPASGSFTTK
jgi:uncharacterized protein YbcI